MSSTSSNLAHPNPNLHATFQPVTEKLVGPNFMAWSMQFMVFLNSHDLIGYIDGTIKAPAETIQDSPNPAYSIRFGRTIVLKVGYLLPFQKSWLLLFMELKLQIRLGIPFKPALHRLPDHRLHDL